MDSSALSLLEPIQLGSIQISNRLVQGPLAGYSCAPFRVLTNRYGNPGFCSSEMISVKTLRYRKVQPVRYLYRDPEEKIACYQISGNTIDDIAFATSVVSEAGADIIDLNCGCPVKKIRSKGCGSKLLQDPEKIYSLVQTMKRNTKAAVSIKIRVGTPNYDSDDVAVAQAAEAAGVDFIVVHGRHWTERYDVASRFSEIRRVVESVHVPVFANGDVEDAESANRAMAQTGAAGLMVCRAGVGNPWLFQEILSELRGEQFVRPKFTLVGEVFIEHLQRLINLESEKMAVLQSRKLAKYYACNLTKRAEFVSQVQQVGSVKSFIELIRRYFI